MVTPLAVHLGVAGHGVEVYGDTGLVSLIPMALPAGRTVARAA